MHESSTLFWQLKNNQMAQENANLQTEHQLLDAKLQKFSKFFFKIVNILISN